MTEPIRIKRGDTFILALRAMVDGEPQDLTHWKIRSSVGNVDGKIADLKVNVLPQDVPETKGQYVLHGNTNNWVLGELEFDIRYTTASDQVVTTNSAKLLLVKSVTPP